MAKKFGLVLGVFVLIGWLGSWFFLSDADYHTKSWAQDKTLDFTADLGFTVKDLLVEGRHYTDADVVMAIVNIRKGDPLLSFDTKSAQDMLSKLSWVKTAYVERRLPDTIYIELTERKPFALWQNNKQVKLIDDEGVFLTDHKLDRFKDFIMVVGKDAPKHSGDFLTLLNVETIVRDKVETAQYVGDRRWDLILKNGITVKLPENDVSLALSQLAGAQEDEALLDKDIKMIDMREVDRIVIRTKPGAVQDYQEYKASYKSNTASGDSI